MTYALPVILGITAGKASEPLLICVSVTTCPVKRVPMMLSVTNDSAPFRCPRVYRYGVSEKDRDRADLSIESQEEFSLSPGAAKFAECVFPFGLKIYTTYKLAHSDPGVIAE